MEIKIEGMYCAECGDAVVLRLSEIPGVEKVEADVETGRVFIDGDNLDDERIERAIKETGFTFLKRVS